jgi:hypothetical protein
MAACWSVDAAADGGGAPPQWEPYPPIVSSRLEEAYQEYITHSQDQPAAGRRAV